MAFALVVTAISSIFGDTVLTALPVGLSPSPVVVNPITNTIYVANTEGNLVTVIDGATDVATPVQVGDSPQAIAVNPETNQVYVANTGTDTVTVIDGATNATATIMTGTNTQGPVAIAVNPVTNKIYVANFNSNTVSVIDGATQTTEAVIPVGDFPSALAVDPVTNIIYVVNSSDSTVSSIDGGTDTVAATIPAGPGAFTIAVNPLTNQIYVADQPSNQVTVIDGQTGVATGAWTVGSDPVAIAVNPVTNRIYVANGQQDAVSVIDGSVQPGVSGTATTIPLLTTSAAQSGLSINPATNRVYIADGNGTVSVIDGATEQVMQTLSAGNMPSGVAVNPITGTVYVTNEGDDTLSVIAGTGQGPTAVYTSQSGGAQAVNPVTNQIYVGGTTGTSLSVIDGATNETSTITLGIVPQCVAVDPATDTIYAAGPDDKIAVVDGSTGAVSLVELGSAAGYTALAVNPVTNMVYVASANETLLALNGATNQYSTIDLPGLEVADLAIDCATDKIYVANSTLGALNDSLSVVDGAYNDDADTVEIPIAGGADALAVNPVTDTVYVAGVGLPVDPGTVTVVDGSNNITAAIPVPGLMGGPGQIAAAVNPLTNNIYVAGSGTNSITAINGANDVTTTYTTEIGPLTSAIGTLAVDPIANTIYCSNMDATEILDGVTGLPITLNGEAAGVVAVDPANDSAYVDGFSSVLGVFAPPPASQSSLATFIEPLPGNTASGNTITLSLSAQTLYGGGASPVRQIYYQVDSKAGAWTAASATGVSASAILYGLLPGPHTIYAFATDGQEVTSSFTGSGSTLLPGAVSAYTFIATGGGAFNFTVSGAEVHDTDGKVTLTVTRNFTQPATVGFQTVDDTAMSGVNYTGTQGTLSFAANQMQQTITVPILQEISSAQTTFFTLLLTNPSAGNTLSSPASAGVYILNDAAGDFTLSNISFTLPTTAPPATDSITVSLSPPDADGQWRIFGELDWRNSGDVAAGLTDGNYEVEFKPVDGYQAPGLQVVPLAGGEEAGVSGAYMAAGSIATGSLQVTLAPANTGGWRLQGETAWRNSGDTVTDLNTGDYIVEFEPVTGLVAPDNCEAVVVAGQTAMITNTYLLGDSTTGLTPVLVSDTIARTQAPYLFTGQIQTDEGFGTGFVPLDRVVLTAAHVLFDDASLSYVQGVRWFFQYESGVFEAPAQIPTGSYILSGYAAQRAVDNSPGVASTASRQLDAAVLYFLEPAARGGHSGYLASNSSDNTWLTGASGKFIAGYPVTGVTPTGRLYATPIVQDPFQYVSGSVFSTDAITSYPGNSGGPLFVQYTDGNFYPAAIYLGGSDETVVRAIDSEVVNLMNSGEVSGNGGANNSGGGIVQVNEGLSGVTAFALGSVNAALSPAGAVSGGAYWEIGDGVKRNSGQSAVGLAPGTYTVQFFGGGVGYTAPGPMQVSVAAGVDTPVVGTYAANAPTITSATAATAIEGQSFSYQATVTPSATGYLTSSTLPSGLTLNGTTGLISGVATGAGTASVFPIELQAVNDSGTGSAFTLALTVAPAGELTVSVNGKGTVAKQFANSTVQAVGSSISIKATAGSGYLFTSWTDADTGNVLSTEPVYVFTMSTAMNLVANFVPNPFVTAKGSYLALLQGGSYLESGFAQIAVKPTGSFTATFNLGGVAGQVVNSFNNQGQYQGGFRLPDGRLYNAALSLTSGPLLSGTLTNEGDGTQIALSAELPAPRADQAIAGAYTVALPAPTGSGTLPGGNGFGTVTVSKTGTVKFAGQLGDGVPLTLSSTLDSHGVWQFLFIRPAGKSAGRELVLGSIAFPAASGTAGILDWYRTANNADPAYSGGFSTTVPFLTGAYAAPAFDYHSASITFSGANLATQTVKTVAISHSGLVTYSGADPFTLKFAPKTGLFTGSFMDTTDVRRVFSGAVLQSGSCGMGLFQGASGQTGSVLLQPAQ